MKTTALIILLLLTSCNLNQPGKVIIEPKNDLVEADVSEMENDTGKAAPQIIEHGVGSKEITTGNTTPGQVISFARSLIGVPYKYGSIDPAAGFDCSGFITYVFSHFNISVPRSSVDFTDVSREIDITDAKPGDIVLFTGTDSTVKHVGHMGIIVSADTSQIEFIHSSSGKANGVTITPLNKYYQGRYVKTIRIFSQND